MTLSLALLICILLYLDSWPVGQFLLGRPVLLLPLLGLACGFPLAGLWLGLVLELLAVRSLPMGSSLPPEPGLAGAWSLLSLGLGPQPFLARLPAEEGMLLALLLALPLCWIAPWLTEAQRRLNGRLWRPLFQGAVLAGNAPRCGRLMGAVMGQTVLLAGLASTLMLLALPVLGAWLEPLAGRLAAGRLAGLLPLPWALLAVALGGLWRHVGGRRGSRFLWSGAAIGLALAWLGGILP
ncbi:MAG: PTS sugar transporter subunit IIC [bacterium]|jgi:hypothetical protein|nr:PTS sugar transporter subunit IIC [bacterium]